MIHDSLIVGPPKKNSKLLDPGLLLVRESTMIGSLDQHIIDEQYALNIVEHKDSYLGGSLTVQQSLTANGLSTLQDLIVNGRVGIGTTTPKVELHVIGTLKAQTFVGIDFIPSGLIGMWSGSVGDIPKGWALCDGKLGTPDLSGRFIVGVGKSKNSETTYEPSDKGGHNEVKLEIQHMPSHSYSIDPVLISENNEGAIVKHYMSHDYYANTTSLGHTGDDQPHENRPPYYTLAFIMKL